MASLKLWSPRAGADGARSRGGLKFASLAACLLAVCLAQTSASLPASLNGAIAANLHATGQQITWVDDWFLIPTAVLGLTFGVIGDLYGRKRTMLAGAVFLGLGALICLTAPSVQVLWVGEAVAGIGAAALFVSSLIVITGLGSDRYQRARNLGLWGIALTLGNVFNPLISGVVTAHTVWRWAYLPIICAAILVLVLTSFAVSESKAPEGRSIDWAGQATMAAGFFMLLYGVIEASNSGWLVTASIIRFLVAIALLAAFVMIELRSPTPMLRLRLFRIRAFGSASVVALLAMCAYVGAIYDMSIRLGVIDGVSTPHLAVILSMLGVVGVVVGPVLRRVLQNVTGRWPLGLGVLAMTGAMIWFSTIPLGVTSFGRLIPPFVVFGIGLCFTVTALAATTVNSVPAPLAGMASGAANQFRQFGQALGPGVIGSIALSRAASDLTNRLAGLSVTAAQRSAAESASAHGGALAVLGGNFGSGSHAINSAAQISLNHGYVIGLYACIGMAAAAAVIALVNVRSSQERLQTDAEQLVQVTPEAEPSTPSRAPVPQRA
ncbi:MAG TPA: MFS transporter [Solirubrobacteraceae bacterium]|jgi:MFS family permease|nr:MFS transporter [Solirubrobacteraceae bacterium]